MKKNIPIVRIHKESGFSDLPMPSYATAHSSGVDLLAAIDAPVSIKPGKWRLISTGIRVALPEGYEGQVRPRSGLALKYGVTLLNTPGTIDSDYRGIIGVILINHGEEIFTVHRGDRIAQMVIVPVAHLAFEEVSYLRATPRGEKGFGSTGLNWDSARFEDEDDTENLRKAKLDPSSSSSKEKSLDSEETSH